MGRAHALGVRVTKRRGYARDHGGRPLRQPRVRAHRRRRAGRSAEVLHRTPYPEAASRSRDHPCLAYHRNERVVDELIYAFTHSLEMDWLLPGVPPTGKRVEVPMVVVVQFAEGKIASEHIYWDQASVL